MKKLLAALLILITLISCTSVCAAPVYSDNVAQMLSELKIMQGDPDGNLRLDDPVTRAECTKIAVAASQYRNCVVLGSKTSPFSDVPYSHWAAPYVSVGITNKLCTGYLDGTFRPNNNVLYEEAATMFLRILGYTNEDFGSSWPNGQVSIAGNIGILDNVNKSVGDTLTRRDVMTMVYNTLTAKQKNSQSMYLSDFNRAIIDDVVLISTINEDPDVPDGKIYTSSGTYNISESLNLENIGKRGSLVLRNGDTAVSFIPEDTSTYSDPCMVYSTIENGIITYKNGNFGQVNVNSNTVIYKGSQMLSAQTALSSLKMGDVLRVSYKSNGEIDYITCSSGTTQGPITIKSSSWYLSFGADRSTTVMRDGVRSSVSDVQINDIAYYLDELDIVLVYSKKVTGIYEDAYPNKDTPTSVTVSGVTYTIESVDAFSKLSSIGTFNLGDTVTLLLGKSGNVADVLTNSQLSDKVHGFLIETGTKETTTAGTTATKPYIKLVLPSGETTEYITSKDYSSYLNRTVTVTLKNGVATIATISSQSDISGKFIWNSNTKSFGSTPLSADVKIIEVSSTKEIDDAVYGTVFPQRLDGVTISSSAVLYSGKNSSGEIDELILLDVTADIHTYGIITKADKNFSGMSISGNYEYISNGTYHSILTSNAAFGVHVGEAVKIVSSNGRSVSSMIALSKAASGKISSVLGSEITISGKTYTMSDKVQVYIKNSSEYVMAASSELADLAESHSAAIYTDKVAPIGRIRIIVLS